MEAAVRKIIESTLVSADGVIGDPPRWAMEYRDAEVTAEVLFRDGQKQALTLAGAKTFGTGVVILTYRPLGSQG